MKKKMFYPLIALMALVMMAAVSPVDASRPHVQVNVGMRAPQREVYGEVYGRTYVVQPQLVAASPVYRQQPGFYDQYGVYHAPMYVMVSEPVHYMQPVYVTRPMYRPPVCNGVSFLWNFR